MDSATEESIMVDFQKLKGEISITTTLSILGINIPNGSKVQVKLDCPKCQSKSGLAVNTDRQVFYCHTAKEGGDIIKLVSHVKDLPLKDAAEWIAGYKTSPEPQKGTAIQREGFKPLMDLDHFHPAVEVTGLDGKIAQRAGIGYCGKGVLKGTVAVPVYDTESGQLLGYLGCSDFIVPVSLRGGNIVELKTTA